MNELKSTHTFWSSTNRKERKKPASKALPQLVRIEIDSYFFFNEILFWCLSETNDKSSDVILKYLSKN